MKIEFPTLAAAKDHVEKNPELNLQTYTLTPPFGVDGYKYFAVTADEVADLDAEDEFNRRPVRADYE
jgi:hypothetical protein